MTFIILITTLLILSSKAAIFSTGKVDILHADSTSNTPSPETCITITIDSNTNSVLFQMITSTIIAWTGFGFEYLPYYPSNYHANTYAIILEYDINFQPVVTEYTLGYKSKGTKYPTPELTIISDMSTGSRREVNATRPVTGTFNFPDASTLNNFQMTVTSAVHFNTAIYSKSLRHRENSHERNFTTVKFQLLPTTLAPTLKPSATPKPTSTSLCCQCTISTFNSGCNIDPQCENKICIENRDSLCCDSMYTWDESCACQANKICNAPTIAPTQGPTTSLATCCACTTPKNTAGCSDKRCEEAICDTLDEYCCDTEWDALCAPQAQDICILGIPLTSSTLIPSIENIICRPRPTQKPTKRRPSKPRDRSHEGLDDNVKHRSKNRKRYKSKDSSKDNSKDSLKKSKNKKKKGKSKRKKKEKKKHYVIADDEETQQDALHIESKNKQEQSGISIVYICVCIFGGIGLLFMIGMVIYLGLKCFHYKLRIRKEHVMVNDECLEDENEDENENEIGIIQGTCEGTLEENESLKI